MPFFSYKAIEQNGSIVKGVVEGATLELALENITSTGLNVIDIKKSNEHIIFIKNKISSRRIKRRDIIEFANNLSVMLKAGIPIVSALSDIAEMIEDKYFKDKINAIRKSVLYGSRLSEAIAAHKEIFPDIFIRLIVVGEETGQLDRSLSDAATHLQRMEDLSSSVKRALIYPIFAIVATTGALLFWMVYVLPKIIAVFKGSGISLPLPTRILIFMSEFSQSYWYLILLSPILLFLILRVLKQNKKIRFYMDLSKIRLPIARQLTHNKLLAIFSEQMRILTVAGITINRSLEIVANVIGNEVFKTSIKDSIQNIVAGSQISEAIQKHKEFPPLVTRMIYIGETSGTLDEQFSYLSDYYFKKLDDISQKLGKMIEPIVIGVIGLLFALIIIGLLFPIYDLVSKMGR